MRQWLGKGLAMGIREHASRMDFWIGIWVDQESALQRSKWRIFWLLLWQIPQGNKLLYARTEGRPVWLDRSEGRGGAAVVISCMILQVTASVLDVVLCALWNHSEVLSREAKWFDIILKGLLKLSKKNRLLEVATEKHGVEGRGFCFDPNEW